LSTGTVFHGQLVAQNEEIEHFQVTSGAEADERSADVKTNTTPFSWYVNYIESRISCIMKCNCFGLDLAAQQ
jgi:hypothetical protein